MVAIFYVVNKNGAPVFASQSFVLLALIGRVLIYVSEFVYLCWERICFSFYLRHLQFRLVNCEPPKGMTLENNVQQTTGLKPYDLNMSDGVNGLCAKFSANLCRESGANGSEPNGHARVQTEKRPPADHGQAYLHDGSLPGHVDSLTPQQEQLLFAFWQRILDRKMDAHIKNGKPNKPICTFYFHPEKFQSAVKNISHDF